MSCQKYSDYFKNYFKQQRLNQLVNHHQVATLKLVRESFKQLKVQQVNNIIAYSKSLLLHSQDGVAAKP